MQDATDGLDDPELIRDIIDELAREFPTLDVDLLTSVVEDCKSRIARPATGGALFLDASKAVLLLEDQQYEPPYTLPHSLNAIPSALAFHSWLL